MRPLLIVIAFIFFVGCTRSQPRFSSSFKEEHKGKTSISVPEVQELLHIIFAITEKGISDSDMINHDGIYYKEVIQHFQPYDNEPLIKSINKELKGGLFYGSHYSRLKMDACGFYFNGDSIIKDSIYPQLNWDNKNYITPYVKQLEDFAMKTGFRNFYKKHQPYYDTLIKLMHAQMPVQKMWNWLEQRFPARYDNYWITFSPLANGQQSTNHFETDNFKQCVIFICGPFEDSTFSPVMEEGLMSKVAFTEIDHNYVNPISDSFKTAINELFADRTRWTAGKSSNGYKTPLAVFNEYMTYATFILYFHDHFSKADFEKLYVRINNQMVNGRGFILFQEFTNELLNLYQSTKKPVAIPLLYPYLLQWCKTGN
jgi:Domain of unknown function (DUF4932)